MLRIFVHIIFHENFTQKTRSTSSYALADWRGPGPRKCENSSYAAFDGLWPALDGAEISCTSLALHLLHQPGAVLAAPAWRCTCCTSLTRGTCRPSRLAWLTKSVGCWTRFSTTRRQQGHQSHQMTCTRRELWAPMVDQSGDVSWRRCGKRQGWQESARTHNRSAGSL
jgi:hypothetical protein